MTNKGFKFEIFPSEKHKELIWKTIGCNRLVWNLCLEKCVCDYRANGNYNSAFDLDKQVQKMIENAPKNPKVKDLSVRSWTCPHCGCKHDRDKNSARNILNKGLRILNEQDTAA